MTFQASQNIAFFIFRASLLCLVKFRGSKMQLKNSALTARFSTLGARLTHLVIDGVDVVMGGATDHDIITGDWTTGAVCGRIAGRITKAQFPLDGETIKVVPNVGDFQLHGGPDNFAIRHWHAKQIDNGIQFSLVSPDGDQGYPGEVRVTATYVLKGNFLSLSLAAKTTESTMINLTNHAYWNLIGGKSAFEHEMQIEADQFLPLSKELLPSGEIRDIEGTRWDFSKMRIVGEDYDNCWVLRGARGKMKKGLTLRDPASGRKMEVWTTEKGMQMYTAFHWNGIFPGKNGPLKQYQAIAIEPQNFAGAPNHANFPSAVLRPGETYRNDMEWRFS
jgi:aldose 1-epimerase